MADTIRAGMQGRPHILTTLRTLRDWRDMCTHVLDSPTPEGPVMWHTRISLAHINAEIARRHPPVSAAALRRAHALDIVDESNRRMPTDALRVWRDHVAAVIDSHLEIGCLRTDMYHELTSSNAELARRIPQPPSPIHGDRQ